MPCPRCKEDLKCLNTIQSRRYEAEVLLCNDSTELRFRRIRKVIENKVKFKYWCSNCGFFICETDKDALKFLQNEGSKTMPDTQSEINMKMKVYLINCNLEDLEYFKKVIDGKIAAFKMEAALDKLRQHPKEGD